GDLSHDDRSFGEFVCSKERLNSRSIPVAEEFLALSWPVGLYQRIRSLQDLPRTTTIPAQRDVMPGAGSHALHDLGSRSAEGIDGLIAIANNKNVAVNR